MRIFCGLLAATLCVSAAAQVAPPPAATKPAPPPGPKAAAVIIGGLGGTEMYSRNVQDWCNRFHAILTGKCGVKPEHVIVLTETEDLKAKPPRQKSTLENVRAAMKKMAALINPDDQFILFVAGHGQIQELAGKLCIPGLDLKSDDLAEMLDGLRTSRMVIVNAASGGADFLKTYLVDGRVILTAGGVETDGNQTYFAEFFLRGYETGGADTLSSPRKYGNGNGTIDMLEAYCYAAVETGNFYHRQYLLESYRPTDAKGRPIRRAEGFVDPNIYWLVRGKETRKVWRKLYAGTNNKLGRPAQQRVRGPDGKMVVLDPLPNDLDAEPDFSPKFGRFDKQWHNRRIMAEHARLDDISNPKKALFLWQPYKFEKIPKEVYDGEATHLARRTVLGRPQPLKVAAR